jgi:hypothetical protein
MGLIRAANILLPGSFGLNTTDTIAADPTLRFAATCSNGLVDSSGKLASRKDFVNQTSGFSGTVETVFTHRNDDGTEVILSGASGAVYSGTATMTSRVNFSYAYQVVDVGGAKAGATATGLSNDATVRTATVRVDGTNRTISVVSSTVQTYTTLLAEINTDISTWATASLVAGNLRITSLTTGASSRIRITDGDVPLFSPLTSFVAIRTGNSDTAPGYQIVNVGSAKLLATATGLANDATSYLMTVTVDGTARAVAVTGSAAQTYTTLLAEINTDISTWATADLTVGNLRITSLSSGASSSISMVDGVTPLLATLTSYVAVLDAVPGWAATSNAMQFASLNDRIYMAQAGRPFTCLLEGTYAEEAIIAQPWFSSPNIVMAAYGRLWAADDGAGLNRYTLWWSDLLNGKAWTTGDAGAISIKEAWPQGQDSIVAIAAAFGRVMLFGRNSIIMYTLGTDNDPGTMTRTDIITNTGCRARDSVVVADDGVYFLGDNGIYRIDRLAQITSLMTLPLISQLCNDDVLSTYASETLTKVRGGYYPAEGLYVLNAPTANKCYVIHARRKLPTLNVPVITTWTNVGMPFRGFCFDKDGNWYCAGTNGVHKYTGYTSDGANNVYTFDYYSQWLSFGDESRLKHLKYVVLTLETDSGQTGTMRWQVDYKAGTVNTATFTCDAVEFAEAPGVGEIKAHIGRSANIAKFGFTMPVSGDRIAFHQMRLFAQTGKTTFR